MSLARITAAICTYNRYDLLPKAVASLERQSLAKADYEILVIDNSPDHAQSSEVAMGFRDVAGLTWIVEHTPGLSNARNVATRNAKSPIIAFMDDDAVAAPDWLEKLAAVFDRFGPQAEVVGGRVDPIWEVPQPKWLADSLLGNVSVVNWGGADRFAASGEWVAGTNIAFRTAALEKVGGFSVHFGRTRGGQALLSNDETDVIERMTAGGARLIYAPGAVVEHLVPAERLTQSWFRRRVAWQAVSDYLLDPQRLFEKAPGYWRGVTEFYARLPPKDRNPRGLYAEQTDPEMFRMQMSAIYNFTVVMLTGFRGLEGA
jgi:glycosyltransferase involved in cell wall biosynthesis